MPITLTDASLPIFKMGLANLAHCLDKAASNASQRSFSPDAFVQSRLAPDMLAFASQIRIPATPSKMQRRVSVVSKPQSLQMTKQALRSYRSASAKRLRGSIRCLQTPLTGERRKRSPFPRGEIRPEPCWVRRI